MDECDGMDRGGSTQLIGIIKKSKIPIICICNDRQNDKIKSLANHCVDLKFRKLTLAQIEKRVKEIAAAEGVLLGANAVSELVQGTQGDVRQILNLLSTWKVQSLSYVECKELFVMINSG